VITFLRIVGWSYAVLCVGSLLLIAASAFGWFGVQPDALAAVYAIVLALPWSLLMTALPSTPTWLAGALLMASMGLNLYIGRMVARRLHMRRTSS
jgi:hypothetical protein